MRRKTFLYGLTIVIIGILIFLSCSKEPVKSSNTASKESYTEQSSSPIIEPPQSEEKQGVITVLKESEVKKPVSSLFNENDYFDMVFVEGGSMEIQGKQINLDSFYMNKYELSQVMYAKAHNWAKMQGLLAVDAYEWDETEIFTAIMSFSEAIFTCNHLSLMENLHPVYYLNKQMTVPATGGFITNRTLYIDWDANGYRLPTEAEWEYAARGGQKSKGYLYAGSNNLDEVAWYDMSEQEYADYYTPPGIKKPNELDLYDMSGNASEWCIDEWTSPARMVPSHNPGQQSVYDDSKAIYSPLCVLKGGHSDRLGRGSILGADFFTYFTPQGRLEGNRYDFYSDNFKEDKATIRLMRTIQGE